jgi:adenylate cyclase
MRAQQHSYQSMMPGEADKAVEFLHQGLAIVPDYAAAHATAACCYEMRYLRGGLQEADKNAALAHARRAIELGADDAVSLATAGFVIGLVAHDYKTSVEAIDSRANVDWRFGNGVVDGVDRPGACGRNFQSDQLCRALVADHPFRAGQLVCVYRARHAFNASDDFASAAEAAGKAIQANPRFSLNHALRAAALSRLGRRDEAAAAAARVQECEPDFTIRRFVRWHIGRADIWEPMGDALRQLDLPEE